MMGRHAGSFYSPLHSMWGTAFGGAGGGAKQYSAFPYASKQEPCSGSEMVANNNNNNNDESAYPMTAAAAGDQQQPPESHAMDFKPPSESLISAAGLSAYSGHSSMISSAARKLPEGTAAAASSSSHSSASGCSPAASPTAPYPYYCSTQDLASMYGSSFAMAGAPSRSTLSAPRPKPKNRTNAGKGGKPFKESGDGFSLPGLSGELTGDE